MADRSDRKIKDRLFSRDALWPLFLGAAFVLANTLPAPADTSRQDTQLPDVHWENELVGMYAEDGTCEDSDKVWVLSFALVEMGQTTCSGLGKMTWDEDYGGESAAWREFGDSAEGAALSIPLSSCRDMADPVADRTLMLRRNPDDSLLAEVIDMPEDPASVRLVACDTPPAE